MRVKLALLLLVAALMTSCLGPIRVELEPLCSPAWPKYLYPRCRLLAMGVRW